MSYDLCEGKGIWCTKRLQLKDTEEHSARA